MTAASGSPEKTHSIGSSLRRVAVGSLLQAIEDRDVRNAAHSMALHADRDLGIHTDTLDFAPHTERAETLIEAGLEPRELVNE